MKTQITNMVSALVLALATSSLAQTNLQFTSATATDEGAIQIHWASQTGHVYQIQYANALATNSDGSTAWQVLYDNYPSHGTNTFIGDFGNYLLSVPPIVHPKYAPKRFYRIVDKGVDDLPIEPTVSIVSPTNGFNAFGQLTITVSAARGDTNYFLESPRLYVDGQEMWPSDDGTNFTLNTCEWGNGTHTLFAVVECLSHSIDPINSAAATVGHAVSPYISVTFSNLVSRISFSEVFFEPSLGQTQHVTASFSANCDWTLTIRDAFSNAVRHASGSGTSMDYAWNGKGDGETNIPNGVYYYYISAQTNGQSFSESSMMSDSMNLSEMDDSTEWYAMPEDGSGSAVPLALYPPGNEHEWFYDF